MAPALIAPRRWLVAHLPQRERDDGASLVEYALLVALIAVICALAIGVIGTTINESYSSTASGFG